MCSIFRKKSQTDQSTKCLFNNRGLLLTLSFWLLGNLHASAAQTSPISRNSVLSKIPSPPFCDSLLHPGKSARNEVATSVPTTGDISLVYIRVRFPEEDPEPISYEEAERDLTNATTLLESLSYGQCHLHWRITPILTLPKPREDYGSGDAFNGLLDDARAAANAIGEDYQTYTFDVIRHTGVAGLASGSANVGNRGMQLSASGWFLFLHELGHNFGLYHAHFWETKGSDLPLGSPPLPSDYKELADPFSIPVHPNSSLGQPNLTGPGELIEYGDPWDYMGSGQDHFSVPNRVQLGWIDDSNIARVTESSIQRIYAPEAPALVPGQHYGIRLPSREHELWVELAPTNEFYPEARLLLRWAQPDTYLGTTLLQPSIAFSNDGLDNALSVGTTFSDIFRNIHVTPIETGGSAVDRWIEVAIELSPSATNRPPITELTIDQTAVMPGEPVILNATAADPDGDAISWHWTFDDSTTATTPNRVEKSWPNPGEYVVQLEASDRKGGVGRSHIVVKVGEPHTAKIIGRVTDDTGAPLAGARVHTVYVEGKNRTLRWMLTDSDGQYSLTQLVPGVYTNGAFAFGWKMDPVAPALIVGQETVTRDFVARALPKIEIQSPGFISEGSGKVSLFTFTRTGSLLNDLIVPFQLSGTAQPGKDYEAPGSDSVVIPSGSASATLALTLLDSPGIEAGRTIQISATIPTQSVQHRKNGKPYTRYYPGLDLESIEGETYWTLTDPVFVPGADANVTILDDDLRLEILNENAGVISLKIYGDPGTSVELQTSQDLLVWTSLSTQLLPRTGTATLALSKSPSARHFFRLAFPPSPPT